MHEVTLLLLAEFCSKGLKELSDSIQQYMCPQFNFVVKVYLQRNGVLASKAQTVFSTTSAHNLIKATPGSA